MERRRTRLNPHAAPSMPPHNREVDDNSSNLDTSSHSSELNPAAEPYCPPFADCAIDELFATFHLLLLQDSSDQNEDQNLKECLDAMDVADLFEMFPDISGETLTAVYSANAGDLDATIGMLVELEIMVDSVNEQGQNSREMEELDTEDKDAADIASTNT